MTRPSDSLDLRELGLRQGAEETRLFDLEIAPLRLGGTSYTVVVREPGVELRVRRIAGGYLVRVSLAATVYGPCARCLDEVDLLVRAEQEEFVPARAEGWDEADVTPFVADFVVDVAGLAREALVLSLPSKVLCDESCTGLCPRCGEPGGGEGCGCPDTPRDERWAALAELDLGEDTGEG